MPVAASQTADDVDGLFNFMLTIATGLFFLVEGTLIVMAIKFRRKPGDQTDGPPVEGNVPLEIVWTAIPTVIVFILAIYSFEVYNQMGGLDPEASQGANANQIAHHHHHHHTIGMGTMVAMDSGQDLALGLGVEPNQDPAIAPLEVDVNGIQYAWIFTYPETGVISGDLHVPVNRPVKLNIKAGDVIHAFWLPEFRIKQDAIPGQDSVMAFTPNRVGNYPIICAELCGSFHGGMKTTLYVEEESQFQQWIQDNTFAQNADLEEAIALNGSQALTPGEYLQPYAAEMGVGAETLAQLAAHSASQTPVPAP